MAMSASSWIRSVARTPGYRDASSRPIRRQASRAKRPAGSKLWLERLEDRTVPTVIDLASFPGQTGSINGAIFTGSTGHNTSGSGILDSFVRLDSNSGVEQGYNTNNYVYQANPITNDAGNTPTF